MKKVISNAGGLSSTVVYLYDGQKIIETRNGSAAVVQQFIHGTQYIDELVMVRVKDKGDLYVHQDANWNVVGLTDLGRHVVERYVYTPYGELLVTQGERDQGGSVNAFGDRDGDNDVDATDKGTVGVTCTGTVSGACRILDVDFDGDYDSTDATKFDALPQGLGRHPGRTFSALQQPFAHQGLLFEPEIGSYQNRARQYDPGKRRFVQTDPLYTAFEIIGNSKNLALPYRQGLSRFASLLMNPLAYTDETGLSCCPDRPCTGGAPSTSPPTSPCNAIFGGSYGGCGSQGACVCDKGNGCCPEAPGGTGIKPCNNCWQCGDDGSGYKWTCCVVDARAACGG